MILYDSYGMFLYSLCGMILCGSYDMFLYGSSGLIHPGSPFSNISCKDKVEIVPRGFDQAIHRFQRGRAADAHTMPREKA